MADGVGVVGVDMGDGVIHMAVSMARIVLIQSCGEPK
ncbi:hypothetical protein AB6A40_004034 [Gnathostoma spinigerum]|uniref:Uncharacterized protein n=1 Tax=Gnathostoma spinigerum TaxID=75299 RepID=A0ABD6EM18_9BILA